MIPPAIAAGLGQLGKHGSIINRKLGANFRLALVLTDAPLVADRPDALGNYGGLKRYNLTPRARQLPGSKAKDLKEPYYYRYYYDTDRSNNSCQRFARRAILTKNSNWWTRYRACKG